MSDQEVVARLIANDAEEIEEFFFVRCRGMLTYIGEFYYMRQSPEELIGEFYEFLSADNWHKLRIFKYTCSLNSYVTIIASRFFQRKRNKEWVFIEENQNLAKNLMGQEATGATSFVLSDIIKVIERMQPLDRFLVERILLDGEKPRDILDEVRLILENDPSVSTKARDKKELAGYIYTRYNRARISLRNNIRAIGYSKFN